MNADETLELDPRLKEAIAAIPNINLDVVGEWTLLKEQIVSYYMAVFNRILSQATSGYKKTQFKRWWIDACCSSGVHINKEELKFLPGSAYLASKINPPFDKYIFIDEEESSLRFLQSLLGQNQRYSFYHADCNSLLPSIIKNHFGWGDYNRGLCFIDPYKISIDWKTIFYLGQAGKENKGRGTIDCLINYPQHDIQRNLFLKSRSLIRSSDLARMNRFWGDDSWLDIIFRTEKTLFEDRECKTYNTKIRMLDAFKQRIKEKAGFKYVVDPFPLKNQIGAEVFYLFFATNAPAANRAAVGTFKKFRQEL